MNAHLIITVDYEVFGNGSGCLEHCVIEPARRILEVAEQFSAPVTFFAETAEFMAMEREDGRDAVAGVRHQLSEAVRRGHDVQLHLHPQWHGATRRSDGTWNLDLSKWRIGNLPEADVDALVAEGKGWIEDVAFASRPGRNCIAFRAGSWCIQPSGTVLDVLRRHRFAIESTVVPGMRRSSPGEWSDFRDAPDRPFWGIDDDVCRDSSNALLEVPIASSRLSRHRQLLHEFAARRATDSRFAPNCSGSYALRQSGPADRIAAHARKLRDLGAAKLDLSTTRATALIEVTRDWIRRFQTATVPVPVVAIAHTKNWTDFSSAQLGAYLRWLSDAGVRCSTYSSWLESVERSTHRSQPGLQAEGALHQSLA